MIRSIKKYICCCYTYDSINVKTNLQIDIPSTPTEEKIYKTEEDGTDISLLDAIPYTFPIKKCRVIKVYDGDTITIAATLPNELNVPTIYKFSVRLNGIDTPELKGSSEDEKKAAIAARDFLKELILNKAIELRNIQNMNVEKFGRILADVYIGDIHVNQLMIDERYALKYEGKTKIQPSSWTKYKETGKM